MDIILVSKSRGRSWRLSFDHTRAITWLPVILAALLVVGGSFALGWTTRASGGNVPQHVVNQWNSQLQEQQEQLTVARAQAAEQAQALSRKIAQLQADMLRLDAAGQRMTQIAGIKSDEFDFSKPAPAGGPETGPTKQPALMDDVMNSLDQMQSQMSKRQRQMKVLEDILLTSRLQKEVKPSGWPVADGYISSVFGMRIDPFTGLRSFHPGIDFAAPEGTPVHAAATGIVTFAGKDAGYGNLVQINHGNGISTRYGHNEKILVHVGERVRKGQVISLVGSTGRSTGPHCHFEVRIDGHAVNPEPYIVARK